MKWHIRIDQVHGLPDFFQVTRPDGRHYNARGLDKLGLAIRKERQRHMRLFEGAPFVIRDQNGRTAIYDEALQTFTYGLPSAA